MKKKNISFAKLSTEECELCRGLELKHIMADDGVNCIEECESCKQQTEHDQRKLEARLEYGNDGSLVKEGYMVRSVGLQKVIILPIMPCITSVCFTKRIIAFHETFASIDVYKHTNKTNSIV